VRTTRRRALSCGGKPRAEGRLHLARSGRPPPVEIARSRVRIYTWDDMLCRQHWGTGCRRQKGTEKGDSLKEVLREATLPMNDIDRLQRAVEFAGTNWPASAGGDTNLVDVYWIAHTIRRMLGMTLPVRLPSKAAGVRAFECVEENLLRDVPRNRVLRDTPMADLAARNAHLADALTGTLPFSKHQNLAVSLYAWHGCIHMGKLLRCTYRVPGGEALYSPGMRRDGYAHIKELWEQEEAQGNPWVRFGVSLARPMEQCRKKENFEYEVHESWIPKGSPYWEP